MFLIHHLPALSGTKVMHLQNQKRLPFSLQSCTDREVAQIGIVVSPLSAIAERVFLRNLLRGVFNF